MFNTKQYFLKCLMLNIMFILNTELGKYYKLQTSVVKKAKVCQCHCAAVNNTAEIHTRPRDPLMKLTNHGAATALFSIFIVYPLYLVIVKGGHKNT